VLPLRRTSTVSNISRFSDFFIFKKIRFLINGGTKNQPLSTAGSSFILNDDSSTRPLSSTHKPKQFKVSVVNRLLMFSDAVLLIINIVLIATDKS
jgi:hypothetical protein